MRPEIDDYFGATLKYGQNNKTIFYKRVAPRDSDPMSDTIITVRQCTEDGSALLEAGTINLKHFIVMGWPEFKKKPTKSVNAREDAEE